MRLRIWGTRGSLAAPGHDTARYGGNTSCVELQSDSRAALLLDAGSGIRPAGQALGGVSVVHILLTHLHLDHIQGLGFFAPLYDPDVEVHVWGPSSSTQPLRERLVRYLSPPLFPVHLRDLPGLVLHDVVDGTWAFEGFRVTAQRVCHPGPTLGFRVERDGATVAYLPDHEPALGVPAFPGPAHWTSGYALARRADLLVHDAQYAVAEYPARVGWGHSTPDHAIAFAALAEVGHLLLFHHDPSRTDEAAEALAREAVAAAAPGFPVTLAAEGATYEVGARRP